MVLRVLGGQIVPSGRVVPGHQGGQWLPRVHRVPLVLWVLVVRLVLVVPDHPCLQVVRVDHEVRLVREDLQLLLQEQVN